MREMGIAGISPGPNLSKRRNDHKVYPYLLRALVISEPNQVWGIDISYIRLSRGWLYLVAVLDWFSRFVVSWELADSLGLAFVLNAVAKALAQAKPDILNSDQGSQFTELGPTGRALPVLEPQLSGASPQCRRYRQYGWQGAGQ